LNVASIKTEITRKDGKKIETWLEGEGFIPTADQNQYYERGRGATLYTERFPWVQQGHDVHLKVWVPRPDGKTHEMEFECQAGPLPRHRGVGPRKK